ncbi:Bug family tripartite tricarboxylate transporter substrate binding protein [Sutcliffiella cohnii]
MLKKLMNLVMIIAISSVLILAGCSSSSTSSNGVFYEGKTIEFLVPFGTGGGTDAFARFVAQYLGNTTEGEPAIQTVNVPGGGSITGTNEYVLAREKNGLSVLVTSASTHVPYFLDDPAVKYDFKQLTPVLGLPTGGVVYVSPDTGISNPQDINSLNEKLVYAGISATGLDLVTLLSFEVLGLDVQAILGYDGRGPSRVAFEQGESNIDYQTTSAYLTTVTPLVEDGKALPLYSFGQIDENNDVVRDPAFPELPSLKEYYVEVYGEEPSGAAWEAYKSFLGNSFTIQKVLWVHGDAPEDAIEALIEGSNALSKDEKFLTDGEEVLGGYEPYVGDHLVRVVENMLNTEKEVTNWVKVFLKENYGVERLELD